jgi:hypothetical protein
LAIYSYSSGNSNGNSNNKSQYLVNPYMCTAVMMIAFVLTVINFFAMLLGSCGLDWGQKDGVPEKITK